jgi:biopolymer transport protein ExbB
MLRLLQKTFLTLILLLTVAQLEAAPSADKGKAPVATTHTAVADTSAAASAKAAAPDTSSVAPDDAEMAEDTVALNSELDGLGEDEPESFHQVLKTKFIEGSAGFMSLVALALVLGLAFCIERIIYLSLSEINAKKMMADIGEKLQQGDVEGARQLSRETRGPVAALAQRALSNIDESIDNIERMLSSYGAVETAKLERGCSWITLFIAIAPSLGFLGTVIGMVMAFEQIQGAGDISPTIVASGMKVALITTIFGIIAAVILQVFYNYILSKIDHLTSQMEESSISLLESVMKYKSNAQK